LLRLLLLLVSGLNWSRRGSDREERKDIGFSVSLDRCWCWSRCRSLRRGSGTSRRRRGRLLSVVVGRRGIEIEVEEGI
jgi:hypothetical protein